jgi:hypothetical protein
MFTPLKLNDSVYLLCTNIITKLLLIKGLHLHDLLEGCGFVS